MRLHFHNRVPSEREDLLQTGRRLESCQREKKVRDAVTALQHGIRKQPENTMAQSLFAVFVGKVTPDNYSGRQKPSQQHICRQMHVMMAVNAFRCRPLETNQLL